MGRGKKISLDTAENLLAQLDKVEPVERGYYASVSAFVNQHSDEFQAALQRGVTHEQIADLMLEHDITVSPTTLRRYLVKQPPSEVEASSQAEVSKERELTIEEWACVAVAAMHVLNDVEWEHFQKVCSLVGLNVRYFNGDDDTKTPEISFTRQGVEVRQFIDRTFVTFGDRSLTWEEIDPDDSKQSQLLYEVLQQQAPALATRARKLADRFRES